MLKVAVQSGWLGAIGKEGAIYHSTMHSPQPSFTIAPFSTIPFPIVPFTAMPSPQHHLLGTIHQITDGGSKAQNFRSIRRPWNSNPYK